MNARRLLPVLLLLVVVMGVGFGIYRSYTALDQKRATAALAAKMRVLAGAIGSEKEPFLDDPTVEAGARRPEFRGACRQGRQP